MVHKFQRPTRIDTLDEDVARAREGRVVRLGRDDLIIECENAGGADDCMRRTDVLRAEVGRVLRLLPN